MYAATYAGLSFTTKLLLIEETSTEDTISKQNTLLPHYEEKVLSGRERVAAPWFYLHSNLNTEYKVQERCTS